MQLIYRSFYHCGEKIEADEQPERYYRPWIERMNAFKKESGSPDYQSQITEISGSKYTFSSSLRNTANGAG